MVGEEAEDDTQHGFPGVEWGDGESADLWGDHGVCGEVGAKVKLSDLFDHALLTHCLNERLVVARRHPSKPLTILNYTERCQYERGNWNEVTRQCRGLIYNEHTGEVVARPFRKFFNYGQAEAGEFDLTAPVTVTDKLDGSLGILYGDEIATRGAFESEQAQHATALFRSRYASFVVPEGWTLLFEIVYPSNRIVCDYGEQDDLILLGAVEIDTGRSVGPRDSALGWPGPIATIFPYASLADALAAEPRQNAEGLVVHFRDTDERVKLKQEDYVRLHRIVTGLNERTVWEHLCEQKPLDELLEPLPDEFHSWVRSVADRLTEQVFEQCDEVERTYTAVVGGLPEGFSQKDYALAVKDHPLSWALFSRKAGKAYAPRLWLQAKPEARRGPTGIEYSEDTA